MGYDNADLHHAARIVPQELNKGLLKRTEQIPLTWAVPIR
jgi:hypothetical protein